MKALLNIELEQAIEAEAALSKKRKRSEAFGEDQPFRELDRNVENSGVKTDSKMRRLNPC